MAHEIEVDIIPPEGASETGDATIHARLEDVTMADEPARTVAEEVLHTVLLGDGGVRATIRVPESAIDPRAHYTVRVHVDTRGDGRVGVGDYVSSGSHPVLTFGRPSRVVVPLRRVG